MEHNDESIVNNDSSTNYVNEVLDMIGCSDTIKASDLNFRYDESKPAHENLQCLVNELKSLKVLPKEHNEHGPPYAKLYHAIDKICSGFSKLCFVKSPPGLGKSYNIKRALLLRGIVPLEVTGNVTEAYLYRVLYENNGKVIWFRDISCILNGIKSISLLKSACETETKRILTKASYSIHDADLPNEFECNCSFIFDFNTLCSLNNKLKEDMQALISRGDYIDLALSSEEIISLMYKIANTPEKVMVTDYIVDCYTANKISSLNLRLQKIAFDAYKYAVYANKNWKRILDIELVTTDSVRNMLRSLIGTGPVRVTDLKRLLLKNNIVGSLKTADRRINEWLFVGYIKRVSADERNFYVKLT